MRRRSKTARLSGRAVGVEDPLVAAQAQGSAGWQAGCFGWPGFAAGSAGTCLRHAHAPHSMPAFSFQLVTTMASTATPPPTQAHTPNQLTLLYFLSGAQ
jgi:hypothetical protein